MAKSIWAAKHYTHVIVEHLMPKWWSLRWCLSSSLGRLSTSLWKPAAEIFFSHSGTKALEGSASDVGGYGYITHISGQIWWLSLRSGFCVGHWRSSSPNWVKHFIMDFGLLVMLTQERAFTQTVATKLEEHSSLKMSLYMVKSVQNLNNLIPKKMFGLLEKYNV